MAKYNSNHGATCESILETDSVSYDTVNQYYCSILKILQHQRSQNTNNFMKEHLCTDRITQLFRVVQVRKKKIKKMQHNEKIDHALSPYMMVKSIKHIEAFLLSKHCFKHNYHVTALRDRFCFLMTHCGVLRSESLFKCELSDLCSIIKSDKSTHSCLIFVMQIITGEQTV